MADKYRDTYRNDVFNIYVFRKHPRTKLQPESNKKSHSQTHYESQL